MPITQSAAKALRQSKKRRVQNLTRKEAFKDALKKIKKLLSEKKADEAKKLIPIAYKALDKAAKTNAIKKNTASRKKARLMKLFRK
ncbi:MAG: 30S ribosomal protein S20 [bacterium]|nr:30S ribosomal protein S20 [bacterium]